MAQRALATAFVNIVPGTVDLENYLRGRLGTEVQAASTGAGDKMAKGLSTGFGSKVGGYFKPIIGTMVASFGALGAIQFFKGAITESSDLNESLNAIKVTYKDSAAGIASLGDTAAQRIGLSKSAFNGLAVQFSAFATTVAGSGGDVVGVIDELSTRGADFASVMNLDVNEAMRLFQSGLAGETEPLRKFGIDLSAAAVEAYALSAGIWDGAGTMTEAQKVQARYGALMEQTSKTQGDFSNTSEELANAQRIASAEFANAQAKLGDGLRPVMTDLTNLAIDYLIPALTGLVDGFKANQAWLVPLIASVVALGIAWGVISMVSALIPIFNGLAIVFGLVSSAQLGSAAATWAMNLAWLASPITWIVVALGILVAGIIYLATQTTFFQDTWKIMSDAVVAAWNWLWGMLKPVFDFIGKAFKVLWDYFINPMITAWLIAFTLVAIAAEWLWKNAIKPALDGIGAAFSWVWKTFIKPFIDMVVGAFKLIGDTAKTIFGAIGGWVGSAFGALVGIVRGPVNGLISLLNTMISSLNGIKIDVPDWVPGIGGKTLGFNIPRIPALAAGGFVTGPTTALIGEAGPEVVTPLKDFERMMGIDGNGRGATVNYYAAPNNSLDAEQALFDAMKRAKVLAGW